MNTMSKKQSTRERILDAAWKVMNTVGLVNATTKAIAIESGRSEALIYRHFTDKQDLFLAVLLERLHPLPQESITPGAGGLADNLTAIAISLQAYYEKLLPITASLFGSPELLRQHRDGVHDRGGMGPSAPVTFVTKYLEAERALGRIARGPDLSVVATLLVGAAFQHGFLAAYGDHSDVASIEPAALAMTLMPLLTGH